MGRRSFSREFKLEAVRLVREGGVSVAQAARDLDLHQNMLRNWVREVAADPAQAFRPGADEAGAGRDRAAAPRSSEAQGRARHPKKSRRLLREGPDMKMIFGFVAKHRGIWPVAFLCEALGVSRSGFYAWLRRGPSARSRREEMLSARIRVSFAASDRAYGARRVLVRPAGCRDRVRSACDRAPDASERAESAPRRRRLPIDFGDRPGTAISANVLNRRFGRLRRTANGWRTSPTSGPPRAGCTWQPCSTCSRGVWSAGR